MTDKNTINPNSKMLSKAVVGGAGMGLPPGAGTPPPGMGAVLLYVPLECMQDKSPIEMQADMGLPWSGPDGVPFWFPQNQSSQAGAVPTQASPELSQAARDVLAERQRQISVEGWTPEHDDKHSEGELSYAAAGYAVAASNQIQCMDKKMDDSTISDYVCAPGVSDPWPAGWAFKACPPRNALVKAGALIQAELERMDRAAACNASLAK